MSPWKSEPKLDSLWLSLVKCLNSSPLLSHPSSHHMHYSWTCPWNAHMLPVIKSGCHSYLALAGAEAAVCDCPPSHCQLLCQKCHLTPCSWMLALCGNSHKTRAWNLPWIAAPSAAPLLQPLLRHPCSLTLPLYSPTTMFSLLWYQYRTHPVL